MWHDVRLLHGGTSAADACVGHTLIAGLPWLNRCLLGAAMAAVGLEQFPRAAEIPNRLPARVTAFCRDALSNAHVSKQCGCFSMPHQRVIRRARLWPLVLRLRLVLLERNNALPVTLDADVERLTGVVCSSSEDVTRELLSQTAHQQKLLAHLLTSVQVLQERVARADTRAAQRPRRTLNMASAARRRADARRKRMRELSVVHEKAVRMHAQRSKKKYVRRRARHRINRSVYYFLRDTRMADPDGLRRAIAAIDDTEPMNLAELMINLEDIPLPAAIADEEALEPIEVVPVDQHMDTVKRVQTSAYAQFYGATHTHSLDDTVLSNVDIATEFKHAHEPVARHFSREIRAYLDEVGNSTLPKQLFDIPHVDKRYHDEKCLRASTHAEADAWERPCMRGKMCIGYLLALNLLNTGVGLTCADDPKRHFILAEYLLPSEREAIERDPTVISVRTRARARSRARSLGANAIS